MPSGPDPSTPPIPAPQPIFYFYDHLGNTRVTYHNLLICPGTILYELDFAAEYYAYGKTMREFFAGQAEKYQTTQHERDKETGFDYRGARFYDSDIGRFLSVDPLAVKFPSISTYYYVLGNPVKYLDPDGRFPIDPNILKNFPRISSFIQNGRLENYITSSERISSTLDFYSSGFLTKDQISRDFKPDSGPRIVMVSNQNLNDRGFDNPENFSGHWEYTTQTIELGEAYLSRIENILKKFEGDEKKSAAI